MTDPAAAVAVAVTFVWLGMVLAISFLEAPLKFRAPGVSVQIGLGIGRLVFRALNLVEMTLAGVLVLAVILVSANSGGSGVPILAILPGGVLGLQLVAVRPALKRRSDRVLAGEAPSGSRAHQWYVGSEILKVVALLTVGVAQLVR